MNKLFAVWDLLNEGRAVANPEFWKKVQAEGQPALATLLIGVVALLKGTKYEIPISDVQLGYIAGGIFCAVNWVLTRITTTKDLRVLPVIPRPEVVPVVVENEAVELPRSTETAQGQQPTNQSINKIFDERG